MRNPAVSISSASVQLHCPREIENLMKFLHGYPPIITLFESVVVLLFAHAITASKIPVRHIFMNRKNEPVIAFKILGIVFVLLHRGNIPNDNNIFWFITL